MKLPRWLVIAMLTTSVLAVLTAAGCWWVTWPQRTSQQYITRIAAGDFERANELMTNASWATDGQHAVLWSKGLQEPSVFTFMDVDFLTGCFTSGNGDKGSVRLAPRGISDFLLARVGIVVFNQNGDSLGVRFIAERGHVYFRVDGW